MTKNMKFMVVLYLCYIISLPSFQLVVISQTESDASSALQTANEKLKEVVELLETASEKKISVSDLTREADLVRQLIFSASESFRVGKYQLSYEQANEAIIKLDQLIVEITERMNTKYRSRTILFVLLGFFSAAFSVLLLFLFVKKIYPWYVGKEHEEYGKLEIVYEDRRKQKYD